VGTLAGAFVLGSAAAQNPEQSPLFQSETRVVEVGIVARDSSGAPVADLTKDDFHVFDNGVEQTIQSFEKMWDPPRAANGLPVGLPPNRPTVIVWNMIGGSLTGWPGMKDAIAEMLWKLPQTVDRIEILALGDELKTVHSFTPVRLALRTAILEFDWHPGPVGDPTLWTIKNLSYIAHDLKKIPGEKNLIWVGGFPVGGSDGVGSGAAARGGFSLAKGPRAGIGGGGGRGREYFQDMADAMRALSDAQVMFYPVAPSMVKPFELDDFARMTGGQAYWEDKELPDLMREAIDDSRDAYVLTYIPGNYKRDGLDHEVKLKIDRSHVDLNYREGYTADPPAK
jgi:VWFA-related protein